MSLAKRGGDTTAKILASLLFLFFGTVVRGFPSRWSMGLPSSTRSSLSSLPQTIPFSSANKNSTRGDFETTVVRMASPNKALEFLKKIGKIGGPVASYSGMGIDEGSEATASSCQATQAMRKVPDAFVSCTHTGVIDDMSETFPTTRCGTGWGKFTDQVMGGISEGTLSREFVHGRNANVLRGTVRLENNGGFIQMATNLALGASSAFRLSTAVPVDASHFQGVELDVMSLSTVSETFNVHLKTTACTRPQMSYRASFDVPIAPEKGDGRNPWITVKIPFTQFVGHRIEGDPPLNTSALTRIGLVAIGRAMQDVQLAVSGVRFFGKHI